MFLHLLAHWTRFFVVEHDGSGYDDDFEVPHERQERIRTEVLIGIDTVDQDAALRFLIG